MLGLLTNQLIMLMRNAARRYHGVISSQSAHRPVVLGSGHKVTLHQSAHHPAPSSNRVGLASLQIDSGNDKIKRKFWVSSLKIVRFWVLKVYKNDESSCFYED